MAKNIVLLSDGTGNSAAKLFKTNVWRLYQSLDLSRPDKQIAFYNDGVGTSSFKPLAILGGAFGWGLKRNSIDIYAFLCRNYEPGDRIYCFGFSRGAFTVRVLAGLIHHEGLVRASSESERRRLATAAYRKFRGDHFHSVLRLEKVGRRLRDAFVDGRTYRRSRQQQIRPGIHFLGLWDTVAAYGLPIDELTRAWSWIFPLSVPDREPLPDIRICHAVAIDDERNTFHPVLFNEGKLRGGNAASKNINQERVTQVWFAGMHSNVGGGYPDDGLSYVTLDWMMRQAESMPLDAGLMFKAENRAAARASAVVLGKLYDSRRGLGGFYRYLPRKMEDLTNDTANPGDQVIIERPKIHVSVIERIRQGTDGYAPIVLPRSYAVVKANGDIVDQPEAFEDPTQSKDRGNRQESVWNLVWWKRVAYFCSVLTFLALSAFPLYRDTTEVCVGRLCFLSPPIAWAGQFLPGFASAWLGAYESHPLSFILLALLFMAWLLIGDRIQGLIHANMNALWVRVRANPGSPIADAKVANLPSDLLYRYRTSATYQRFIGAMKRFVLPLLAGIAAASVLLQTAARLSFQVMSSGGLVCSEAAAETTPLFWTDSVCWFTGVKVKEGRRYRITIYIPRSMDWYDTSIPATTARLGPGGIPLRIRRAMLTRDGGFFLRRVLREPWFEPIARIGRDGGDLYPLGSFEPSEGATTLASEITARRDGELFLFVNDAVLPVGNGYQWFYQNNHGGAEVAVKELVEEP